MPWFDYETSSNHACSEDEREKELTNTTRVTYGWRPILVLLQERRHGKVKGRLHI